MLRYTAAKYPDGFSREVVARLGGQLRNLNIECLAGYLVNHGVLNQDSYQKVLQQGTTDLKRGNDLLSELMKLVNLPCYRKKLPGLLYLACLDSFENDPFKVFHHYFAVEILRPQSKQAVESISRRKEG